MRLFAAVIALASASGLAGQAVEDGIPDVMCCCPETRGAPNEVMADVQPLTAKRSLQCAGYESSGDSLTAALRDPRAYVRSRAAGELAKELGKDAIPAIVGALAAEAAPGTRIWMANALAQLGEARGTAALADMCNNYSDPDHLVHQASLRLVAASDMFRLGNESCRDGFIATLRFLSCLRAAGSPANPPALVASELNLALSVTWGENGKLLLEPRALEVREIAERSLADSDSGIRMMASNILGIYGDAGSVEKLQKALATEPDPGVRRRMAAALKKMEGGEDHSGQEEK